MWPVDNLSPAHSSDQDIVTPERIAKVCDAAADLLETDGWCQNKMHHLGHHCLVGALDLAAGGVCEPGLCKAVLDTLTTAEPGCSTRAALSRWNDEQTSRRPVVRLLRRTASAQRGTA